MHIEYRGISSVVLELHIGEKPWRCNQTSALWILMCVTQEY